MAATALRQPARLSIAQFLAFRETRPEEERWELIDGVARRMASPTIRHQLIVSALERALNDALAERKPAWLAVREIGVELAAFPNYRPEPDVVVVDADIDPAARHASRFYLAAEVLSDSDQAIDAKVAFYQSHPSNEFIVLVRQDVIGVTQLARQDNGFWHETSLTSEREVLELGDLGAICAVGDLYRGMSSGR